MKENSAVRNRALIAIALAGAVLNPALPASSANGTKSAKPSLHQDQTAGSSHIIDEIAERSDATPESRSFYLLQLAICWLTDKNRYAAQSIYDSFVNSQNDIQRRVFGYNFLAAAQNIVDRARRIDPQPADLGENQGASESFPGRFELARTAIEQAVKQAKSATDESQKLWLYSIAAELYRASGDSTGEKRCEADANKGLRAFEKRSTTDQEQIKSCAALLTSLANRELRVRISDETSVSKPVSEPVVKPNYTDDQYELSEGYRLRAIALLDRLDSTSHLRRKAHRDMVLWYMAFGKNALAGEQKKVLFELTGASDDSILYPKRRGCGQLTWWRPPTECTPAVAWDCGMG